MRRLLRTLVQLMLRLRGDASAPQRQRAPRSPRRGTPEVVASRTRIPSQRPRRRRRLEQQLQLPRQAHRPQGERKRRVRVRVRADDDRVPAVTRRARRTLVLVWRRCRSSASWRASCSRSRATRTRSAARFGTARSRWAPSTAPTGWPAARTSCAHALDYSTPYS